MPNPLFRFFESIADELCLSSSRVITGNSLQISSDHEPMLDELKAFTDTMDGNAAIRMGVKLLEKHFKSHSANLPFQFNSKTGRFSARDHEYLQFVAHTSNIRSIGKRAREFEQSVLNRLKLRLVGSLHRIGFPRTRLRRQADVNAYLYQIGFNERVLKGQEKDGGFDLLWLPRFGAIPHCPIVSIQCKNGEFNMDDADKSIGAALRSFGEHRGLLHTVHVPCILFNDYIEATHFTSKPLNFVPLGLSDLSKPSSRVSVTET